MLDYIGNDALCNHVLSRIISLSSFSIFFIRQPAMSPSSQCPASRDSLFLTSSSTRFSKSVESISPATFRHWGLLSSSFISSTLAASFSKTARIWASSLVSCCSFLAMYSLMYLSLSLKASSTTLSTRSRRALNSLLITLPILELKASMRQVTLESYLRILPERFYRQWLDSSRADQKEEADISMPLQRPAYDRYEGTAREGDSRVLCCCWYGCCWREQEGPCWQFCPCWQSPPWEIGCSRARQGECSLGASCWKLAKRRGSSWKSCLLVSSARGDSSRAAMLERLSKLRESLDLLRERLREFWLGELEKRDFFWRKPSRLLSLLLLILVDLFIILQQNYCRVTDRIGLAILRGLEGKGKVIDYFGRGKDVG